MPHGGMVHPALKPSVFSNRFPQSRLANITESTAAIMVKGFAQILFWTMVLLAFVMASLPQPPDLPISDDKMLHMLAFAALALLAATAYPRASWPVLLIGLGLFGAFIEIAQEVAGLGRVASMQDWIADIVAASLTLLVIGLYRLLLRWHWN